MHELDLYTPATLTHSVNKILPENRYLTKILGGGRVITAPTESTMFDVKHGRRDLAPMGHNGDPATRVDLASTFETKTVTPPQIFLEDTIHASAVAHRRMAGQNPITVGSGNSDAVTAALNELIADKQKNMVDAIARRMEWMYSQIVTTGGISYMADSNGRPFSVDFGVPDSNKFALSAKWDANTNAGDPLIQLQQLRRTFAEQNGINPTVFLLGKAAADAFRGNANVKSWLKSPATQFINVNIGGNEDLVTPIATVPGVGTLVEYCATYPADGTGTATPYIPENAMVMTHPSLWDLHYGAIVDFDLGENPILMAPRFSKIKLSQDGKTRSLYVESHPLPVLTYDTGIMVVEVCG